MTLIDPWEPTERDWKEFAEPAAAQDSSRFDTSIWETTCPGCERTVGALIIEGPDERFADLGCPHSDCRHEWTERLI